MFTIIHYYDGALAETQLMISQKQLGPFAAFITPIAFGTGQLCISNYK